MTDENLSSPDDVYRAFFEQHPHPMFVYDRETLRFLLVNDAAVQQLGYTREELLAMTIKEIRPASEVPKLLHLLRDLPLGRQRWGDVRYRTRDGRLLDVEVTSHDIPFDGRQARAVVAVDVTERKRAQEMLREEETRFGLALEHAPIGMALMGLDGAWLEVNRALCEIVGYSEQELLGLTFQDVTHPEDLEAALRHIRQLLAGEISSYQMEKRYIRKDGRPVWAQLTGSLVRDGAGSPLYFIAQIQDIDDRKQADAALRESEERYRLLFEMAPVGVVSVDARGRYLRSNPAFQAMLGYTHAELLGLHVSSFTHPDDIEPDLQLLGELNEGKRDRYLLEKRYLRKDGQLVWARVVTAGVRDAAGKLEYTVAIVEDTTERRRAEEAVRRSERRFRALTEHAQDVITVLNPDGTIRYKSPSVERVLGYRPEELIGRSAFELLHPDDVARVREVLREGLKGRQAARGIEYRFLHRDGSWHTLESTGSNALSDPAVRGVIVNSRDVTERREAEARLARYAEELHTLSLTDDLTGLYNRRGFLTLAEPQIKLANRMRYWTVLLYGDLDGLKPINDRFGHPEGDQALREAAGLLRESFRETDLLARVGGDEFTALAMVHSPEEAEIFLSRLRRNLDALNTRAGRRYPLSLSMGVVTSDPEHPLSLAEMLSEADARMYEVKQGRRLRQSRVG